MFEGERLACDGRQCFTQFYYIIEIGPSILVNDSSARGLCCCGAVILRAQCAQSRIAAASSRLLGPG